MHTISLLSSYFVQAATWVGFFLPPLFSIIYSLMYIVVSIVNPWGERGVGGIHKSHFTAHAHPDQSSQLLILRGGGVRRIHNSQCTCILPLWDLCSPTISMQCTGSPLVNHNLSGPHNIHLQFQLAIFCHTISVTYKVNSHTTAFNLVNVYFCDLLSQIDLQHTIFPQIYISRIFKSIWVYW